MKKILCIIGAGGSGKDTLCNRILENEDYSKIMMSTTRPKRENEVDGIDYYFRDDEYFNRALIDGKVIECRNYDTVHGMWYYFTEKQELDPNKNYVMVMTPNIVHIIKDHYKNFDINVLHLRIDPNEAFNRSIDRIKNNLNVEDVKECFRRVLDDISKFENPFIGTNKSLNIYTTNLSLDESYDIIMNELKKNRMV